MNLFKILRNAFLVVLLGLSLSACATKSKNLGSQIQGDVYTGTDTVEYLAKGVDHEDNYHIGIEATSMFGNEESGPLTKERVEAGTILFVGPNPYDSRNFYGSFKMNRKGEVVCE